MVGVFAEGRKNKMAEGAALRFIMDLHMRLDCCLQTTQTVGGQALSEHHFDPSCNVPSSQSFLRDQPNRRLPWIPIKLLYVRL